MSRDEEDCMGHGDWREWHRQRELELDEDVFGVPAPKPAPIIEPCAVPPPLATPAKPGNYFAAAARKAGCEDEYDNAMEARYGKGW
jgi:hypothetical protein